MPTCFMRTAMASEIVHQTAPEGHFNFLLCAPALKRQCRVLFLLLSIRVWVYLYLSVCTTGVFIGFWYGAVISIGAPPRFHKFVNWGPCLSATGATPPFQEWEVQYTAGSEQIHFDYKKAPLPITTPCLASVMCFVSRLHLRPHLCAIKVVGYRPTAPAK